MRKSFNGLIVLAALVFLKCSSPKSGDDHDLTHPKHNTMKNLVSIVEIPATDFPRAVAFYKTILGVAIEEVDMSGTQMGVLAGDSGSVNLVLIKGNDYKPSPEGSIVYLNAGDDLQPVLDRLAKNGGRVIVPKTEISPEMGYYALFIDSEGNRMGLHSTK